MQLHYHWGQAAEKRHGANLNYAHQAEKQFEYGWLERQQCNLHSFF